jgi:bla regulator protein blaR1
MSLANLSPLANHLWQSTLFVAVVWLLAFYLRGHRAQVRFWLWLAASMKFLIPFAALVAIGGQFDWRPSTSAGNPEVAFVIDTIGQPFSRAAVTADPASHAEPASLAAALPILLLAIWLVGCALHLLAWWVRWRRVAAVVRDSSLFEDCRVLETLTLKHI